MIKRTPTFSVTPTPEELTQEFCDMDESQQADFFNMISKIIEEKWEAPFCFQLQAITDCLTLSSGAREIMSAIGEYSSKQD